MILLDTHVVWWLGYEPEKLSPKSVEAIRLAPAGIGGIALSAASIYELAWLLERRRITSTIDGAAFITDLNKRFTILPIDGEIALQAARIPTPFHGDPMDRLIVTTARLSARTLVTADSVIRNAGFCRTAW